MKKTLKENRKNQGGKMKMQHGKWYCFAERCIVRGKPANTVKVSLRGGYFVKETKAMFVFDGFSVRKSVILEIYEESKDLRNLVEHLESLLMVRQKDSKE